MRIICGIMNTILHENNKFYIAYKPKCMHVYIMEICIVEIIM